MEKRNVSLTNPLLVFVGVFLLAFLLVFVVITRWLWPVQWSEGAPRNLAPASQEQWLRLAIDSYSVNPDAGLAVQRYADLGDAGPEVLAQIQVDPAYQSPADIAAFAAAIGASGEIPPAPGHPIPVGWQVVGWILGLLFLLMLAYLIYEYWRGRQAEKQAEAYASGPTYGVEEPELARPPWEAEPEPAAETDLPWPDETFAPGLETEAESLPEESEAFGLIEPEAEPEAEPEGEAEETPRHDDVSGPDEGGLGGAALAAGAVAAGAVAAGALAGEPDEAEETPEADEWQPEDMSGAGVAAAAGAAAGMESLDDDLPDWLANLELEEEDLPGQPGDEASGWVSAGASDMPDWLAELDTGEQDAEQDAEQNAEQAAVSLSPEDLPKFRSSIEMVEGIGPVYADQLREMGIHTPLDLLQAGANPAGRKRIADETGLSHKLILRWVNQVDLYRIKGIGSEYAELLEAAGVDTVVELAQRVPANLHGRMAEVNAEKSLVRQLPTEAMVTAWVEQAKTLPRILKY